MLLIMQRITQLLNGEVALTPSSAKSVTDPAEGVSTADQPTENDADAATSSSSSFSAPLREALSQLLPVVKVRRKCNFY